MFIREKNSRQSTADGKINIGVTGLSQSVGATMIASSLAFFFGEKGNHTAYVDCHDPTQMNNLLFDMVSMDKRFSNRTFHSFYALIREGKGVRDKQNKELGINWVLITPDDCKEKRTLSREEQGRLIHCCGGDVAVFDIDSNGGWDYFLVDMDYLVVVVDPLPSKLIHHANRFKLLKKLELSGLPVFWLVNMDNTGISRRQVHQYLKTKEAIWVPKIPAEEFYLDEFSCKFHWENPAIRSKLMEVFIKISH